jgi:hypothetical protein
MGIVFDSEMYRATEKHFAPYPLPPSSENKWQTWHTDACYDNGYFSTVMFATTGPIITVALQIVDANGKPVVESMQFFEPEDYVFSTEGYDLKMGGNIYRGKFPKIEIFVHDEDNNGAELVVEALVQPTLSELPDGIGIGRMKTPNMPVSVAWFFLPWNRITGKLIVQGKEIPVSGHGWSDHQFGTADFFKDACQYFYWANFPLGQHTVTLFEAQATERGGYRPIKWLWDFKGEKLYEYCRSADYYIEASDIEEGDTVPRKLVYVFEHNRIRGKVTCIWKTLIQKQSVDIGVRMVILNRSAYDCHAELEIDGEKIDTRFTRILEAAYPLDPIGKVEGVDGKEEEVEVKKEEAKVTDEVYEENPNPRFTLNSKLGQVLKDPEGLAVMEKYLPGISKDPSTKLGSGMTLKMIFSMTSKVTPETRAAIDRALRALK